MKPYIGAIVLCAMLLCFTACGGNANNVDILDYESNIYTDAEIDDAVDVAIDYFKAEFSGCTMREITYAGDDALEDHEEFAAWHNADEVIVLVSSFDVDASGGDGSLNPNSTYSGWKWILVRNNGGDWRHADHGYG